MDKLTFLLALSSSFSAEHFNLKTYSSEAIQRVDGNGAILDRSLCKSYDPTSLYVAASRIMEKAQVNFFNEKDFPRVVNGYFGTVVNETAGSKSGGGTNTFGSYGSHIFPGEVLPSGFCDIPNKDQTQRCGDNVTLTWALGPSDVVAYVGCTPPSMRYFSFDADIMARTTEENIYFPGVNFGDTISHLSINTSSDGIDVFDEPILVLVSADAAAAKNIANAYIQAGFPAEAINFKPLPANNPNIRLWDRSVSESWQVSRPDILSSVFRMAVPDNETSYRLYQNIYWPAKFYFKSNDAQTQEPIAQNLRNRSSSSVMNETIELKDVVDQLEERVKEEMLSQNLKYVTSQIMDTDKLGFYDDWNEVLALKNNDSYIVADRDALYGIPRIDKTNYSSFYLKKGTQVVIVGIIHRIALNAAYSSVGIDVVRMQNGKVLETHWWLDQDLTGSAERYFTTGKEEEKKEDKEPLLPYLFAIDIKGPGECNGAKWCAEFNSSHIFSEKSMWPIMEIFERIYLVEDTKVGPDATTVVPSRLLIFQQ